MLTGILVIFEDLQHKVVHPLHKTGDISWDLLSPSLVIFLLNGVTSIPVLYLLTDTDFLLHQYILASYRPEYYKQAKRTKAEKKDVNHAS